MVSLVTPISPRTPRPLGRAVSVVVVMADERNRKLSVVKTMANIPTDATPAETATAWLLIPSTTAPAGRTDHWYGTGNWRITCNFCEMACQPMMAMR
jgi:hypothetical protein